MNQSSNWTKGGIILAALLVLAAVLYWIFSPADSEKPIRTMIADLQRRSLPSDGRLLASSGPEFDNRSVTAAWELESAQQWDEYARWINDRFGDFQIAVPEEGKLLLLKQLPGDTLRISIERINDHPSKVRISLHGYPS